MPRSPTERFGMVVFASQRDRPPYSIFKTHTFTAFVDHGTSSVPPSQVIISWLPTDGRVGLGLFPEPGKPFTLQDSFDWTFGVGPYEGSMALSAWHAVAIDEELYHSAKRRVRQMADDRYQYYFFGMQEIRRAVNCTHALSNLDLFRDELGFVTESGIDASRLCLNRFRPYWKPSKDPRRTEDALGLDKLGDRIEWITSTRAKKFARVRPAAYFRQLARSIPAEEEWKVLPRSADETSTPLPVESWHDPAPQASLGRTGRNADDIGPEAYLWGWPLVNAAVRARRAAAICSGEPITVGGMPVAFGRLCMLTGYMDPDERVIACPNRDVAYGLGVFDLSRSPVVVQVPDFGTRPWTYPVYDARTNQTVTFGPSEKTQPGFHLLAGPNWSGVIPAGIHRPVQYSSTNRAFLVPRIYLKNTAADRAVVKHLVSTVDAYPLSEFTGQMTSRDWDADIQHHPSCWPAGDRGEMVYVRPLTFLDGLHDFLNEVPPRRGEEGRYAEYREMIRRARLNPIYGTALRAAFRRAEREVIAPLMAWAENGRHVGNRWNTSVRSAEWGQSDEDIKHRAATARSNMFESKPSGTRYYYTDFAADGQPLNGSHRYEVTFPPGQLPPVHGFWSISLYNEDHFFHTAGNPLGQYLLGTKDEDTLRFNDDGSLTIYAGGSSPGPAKESNWLPAPVGRPFSLYIRAYVPRDEIDAWVPPGVVKT